MCVSNCVKASLYVCTASVMSDCACLKDPIEPTTSCHAELSLSAGSGGGG